MNTNPAHDGASLRRRRVRRIRHCALWAARVKGAVRSILRVDEIAKVSSSGFAQISKGMRRSRIMSAPSIVTTVEMAQPGSADLTELFPEVVVHPHSEGAHAALGRNIAHAMSWHWASRNEAGFACYNPGPCQRTSPKSQ